ncbi:family 1 glycosylhydrolase [Microtetraspora sp. AC03309]|uniref:glycoside hydrolase family 1 protein n=1 Tax=Microtetraspora sp. AC03309 TaxID=2779376 RepID=UPI001E573042|nr:family 1 glycosylhydrolase [Microtetraspora sp. AC03309]MCC5578736.1 family 1 glycosylhydrolase [Microtetraspora sp. AC03309]
MSFPDGFLWGAATAAHQVEGNNVNSDFWVLENIAGTIFAEPSGDACDHYRLYRQDVALLAELGLTSYRFSVEWARVEPEPGRYSRAALAHYRDVLNACHEHGLTPMVTLHHFTSPRWLMRLGGWSDPGTPERFAAYCRTVMAELGPLIPYVCTINEANIGPVIHHVAGDLLEPAPVGLGDAPAGGLGAWLSAAAHALGTTPDRVNPFLFAYGQAANEVIMRAHTAARAEIRKVSPDTRVGLTLALQDYHPEPGGQERARQMWRETFEDFLPALDGDDFLGVQSYSRMRVGPDGLLPVPDGAEVTQMGYEFFPGSLENVIRGAAAASLPMIVTENGIATADDTRRTEYVRQALEGVRRCLADGIDVGGYYYWSALDNFEWVLGYAPTFGIIAVDRVTQTRTVKDSARYLGALARRNGETL